MLVGVLVTIHLVASIFLILIVLLQTGKGQDLASAFGGGGSNTVFGAAGAATFLHKMTVASAIVFMFTSLTLSILWSAPSDSVISDSAIPTQNREMPVNEPVTGDTQSEGLPGSDSGESAETVPATGQEERPVTGQEERSAPDQSKTQPENKDNSNE